MHVLRPLLADLLATFCFYASYAATGNIGAATILATCLGVAQLAWTVVKGHRVPPIQLASLMLVLVTGAISMATGDARYVLYKASIIYLVIGVTMLRPGWLSRYVPPIAQQHLSNVVIVVFGYSWSALLIGTGLLNLTLIWTEPARTVALVMGIWASASKIGLVAAQYLVGRMIVRRNIAAHRATDAVA